MLGIIGGTGLYRMDGLETTSSVEVDTPFGAPSAPITIGRLDGAEVAFLPRHGAHHQHLPTEINFRANIWALKHVGVTRCLSVSAVGSLEADVAPGDLCVPDQYLDWTKGLRRHTFFGEGVVAHISTAHPTCPRLTDVLRRAAPAIRAKVHFGGTYACVEGPRLGNRAESEFHRRNGCRLVGMTNVPEVYLAREAQIAYCTIAVVTDYDCWHEDPDEHVTVELVMQRYRAALGEVAGLLRAAAVIDDPDAETSLARRALDGAVMTPEHTLSPEKRALLELLRA